ncbi:hypothetical protein FRC06_010167, partial [Ceratobasidium sp. 370]
LYAQQQAFGTSQEALTPQYTSAEVGRDDLCQPENLDHEPTNSLLGRPPPMDKIANEGSTSETVVEPHRSPEENNQATGSTLLDS